MDYEEPSNNDPVWQAICESVAMINDPDDRDRAGDAICDAYSHGVAKGIERHPTEAGQLLGWDAGRDFGFNDSSATDRYEAVALELHRIASQIDTLPYSTRGLLAPTVGLDITFGCFPEPTDQHKVGSVDTFAQALLGYTGRTVVMANGTYHHTAEGKRGPVNVSIYEPVSPRARDEARATREREREETFARFLAFAAHVRRQANASS